MERSGALLHTVVREQAVVFMITGEHRTYFVFLDRRCFEDGAVVVPRRVLLRSPATLTVYAV